MINFTHLDIKIKNGSIPSDTNTFLLLVKERIISLKEEIEKTDAQEKRKNLKRLLDINLIWEFALEKL